MDFLPSFTALARATIYRRYPDARTPHGHPVEKTWLVERGFSTLYTLLAFPYMFDKTLVASEAEKKRVGWAIVATGELAALLGITLEDRKYLLDAFGYREKMGDPFVSLALAYREWKTRGAKNSGHLGLLLARVILSLDARTDSDMLVTAEVEKEFREEKKKKWEEYL